ncbi:type II toxin-antitoxin system VapC family toxin [Microbacterium sp.]|uniref:type II toxin-antitoxin system VapC family toxin n=1 Tax=Microbacterium sp. TaxID=51671 RepID=UPI00289C044C|nr:type II toxin-antitoxin system VapC family toxin [Microbacterium sp.]
MIVLDTNVVSEAIRPAPDAGVVRWLNAQTAETLYLASVTIAELRFGIGALPPGARKDRLTRAVDGLEELFTGRILSFDQRAAHRYAEMTVRARAAGRPLPAADGYLAATAASHEFAVATRNTRDFADTGVDLINPWQDA